jgi:hypothetical protein
MKRKVDSNLNCPACQGTLTPRVLACDACGIKVEGAFGFNEFSTLEPELLHFLRIFVHCDGRIKDMEKALGVSYPTVKAQMVALKRALDVPEDAAEDEPAESPKAKDVLQALERGEINYQEALKLLKRTPQ